MNDMKPLASLSGSLLARKGGARPAMRPQFQRVEAAVAEPRLDDLGWDDMGEEDRGAADILPLTPAPRTDDETARIRAADAEAAEVLAANARSYAEAATAPTPLPKLPSIEPEPVEPEVRRQQGQLATALEAPLMPMANPADVRGDQADVLPKIAAPNPASESAKAATTAPAINPKPARTPRQQSALDRGRRAAFTLRLDAERHLKLRLAATIRNQSAQAIVTAALDDLLGTMPELDSLAAQVKRP